MEGWPRAWWTYMVNTGKLKWNTSIPLEYRAQMEYGGIRLYSTALLIYYINIQTVRHYILQTLPGIFPEYTLLSSPLLTCCRTPAPPRSSSHASASRKRADRRACAQSARLMPHASPPSGWQTVTITREHATSPALTCNTAGLEMEYGIQAFRDLRWNT